MCAFIFAFLIAVLPRTSMSPPAFSQNFGNTYETTIRFYPGPTVADYVEYDMTTAHNVADHPQFNLTLTNMFYIHGWRQSTESRASEVLLNAYLTNGAFNIFTVDWSEAASNNRYDLVVQKVQPIARAVALFIDRLNLEKGVPFSKIHLIGHSVGAHLAGSVGKYTKKWSDRTKVIDRITGLDPAFIGSDFLQSRYARFVDVIHTNPNGYGTRTNCGHVDFWPNHGHIVQPGCPSSGLRARHGCSHNRAIEFFAESVQRANRTGNFLSTNNDNANHVIEMGLNCPTSNVQGVFSLSTNAASWYSQS